MSRAFHFPRHAPRACGLAWLVSLASLAALHAATRTFQPLPEPAFADTEACTNAALSAWSRPPQDFNVTLSLDATPSNNVQVAFGRDDSGDGTLSDEETSLTLGWDCGAWTLASDAAPDRFSAAPAGSGPRRTLAFELRLDGAGKPRRLSLKEDGTPLDFPGLDLSATLPGWLYASDWTHLKVTARGADAENGTIAVEFSADAILLLIR
jgi:hypothetical protein